MIGTKVPEGRISLQPFFDGLKQHLKTTTVESLAARRTPKQVSAVVDTLNDAFETSVAGLSAQAPPERPLACKKGCDHCCHVTVMVDAATVLRIADFIRETFGRAERTLLDMRMILYEDKVEKMTQSERSRAQLPCPLLVDGACTVHPVRPLVCRSFNSYDAEVCKRQIRGGGSTTEIPSWNIPWLLGLALDSGIKDALVESGYADGDLELGLGLKAALDHPNSSERWLAGDRIFARAAWKARKP